jgi:hypothetical protein
MSITTVRRLLIGLASAFATQPMSAQVAYDSPRERVEILGLQQWTLQMLRDSVRSRIPGLELHDAACMIVLRDSLGFADALVNNLRYATGGDAPAREFLVIKLVEPQARGRVQWLRVRRDTFTVLRPEYAPIVLAATDSEGGFWTGRVLWPLQFYGRGLQARAEATANAPAGARADAERLWMFLANRRSDGDWRKSYRVLRRDGDYANRLVAASILANFPERDSTWLALTDALRDPHEAVRSAAAMVLQGFPARKVDWAPEVETLRLLVGGTNVGATQQVFEMLARTEVAPSLARQLLQTNEYWILSHLRAEYPGAASSARALLVQLHGGVDLGAGDAAWATWIAKL